MTGTALKSLLGQVDAAERALGELDVRKAPPMVSAIAELAKADLALRRIEVRSAKASLDRALLAARPIPALAAEIEQALASLEMPSPRRSDAT